MVGGSEITEDDPRLAKLPAEQRRAMLKQKRDPDMMVEEACAITTRVAPSFLRVGHLDLFARRARKEPEDEQVRNELAVRVRHVFVSISSQDSRHSVQNCVLFIALKFTYGYSLSSSLGDSLDDEFFRVCVTMTPSPLSFDDFQLFLVASDFHTLN
jgi:uncharacterized protein YdiU (UPF0061 family)